MKDNAAVPFNDDLMKFPPAIFIIVGTDEGADVLSIVIIRKSEQFPPEHISCQVGIICCC